VFRRFLIHVLPHGFHRIRHYGLFAKANCAANIAHARELLAVPQSQDQPANPTNDNEPLSHPCPCCGGRMIIIETFERGATPRHRPTDPVTLFSIDTSMRCSKSALYSITSLALSCMSRLTVSPSAVAVFRLITSSNLVGCSTGRSLGFSPLRMRPL